METPPENPNTSDELFVGYTPAFRGNAGWRHSFRQHRGAPNAGVVRRVTFSNTEDPHQRLLVDVAEFPTAQLARDYLQESKEEANFAIARGPAQFGPSSLAFPGNQPRTLYFARANLMIWIYSCGRAVVPVVPWAGQMMTDFDQEAATARDDLRLTQEPSRADAPQAVRISIALPWERGEWAWRRFKATGGTLSRAAEGDDVFFWPAAGQGEKAVTGWAFEPGRETYRGRLTIGGAGGPR